MNREKLKAASEKMAGRLNKTYSARFMFRGEAIRLTKAVLAEGLNLQTGGFRVDSAIKLRFPREISPPPGRDSDGKRIKEKLVEVLTGATYHITKCIPADPDSGHAVEHIVEAELA